MPVRRALSSGLYRDSVALMRLATELEARPGVDRASAVMATPANLEMLGEAALAAGPNDLLVIVEGNDVAVLDAALDVAREIMVAVAEMPGGLGFETMPRPRSLVAAAGSQSATIAVISCPGDYATAEAMKALRLDLDVMVFSDNVSGADELALKTEAAARGRLVMGPDCGTAIIQGIPLGFANAVRRGPVGIVAASGTGLQQVACLIDRAGSGISHAIGVGGRDLSDQVGGTTTLAAIDLLAGDDGTDTIVVISKPPGEATADRVIAACDGAQKPCVICFIGRTVPHSAPAKVHFVETLEDAAAVATATAVAPALDLPPGPSQRRIAGLYSGGTFCHEAEAILRSAPDLAVLMDLGDDAYTRGRPHPMIDAASRCEHIAWAAVDPSVGVILLDVVLGTGAHPDPAGALSGAIKQALAVAPDLKVVGFVCGTEADAQGLSAQESCLAEAGVILAVSNAAAVRTALRHLASAS